MASRKAIGLSALTLAAAVAWHLHAAPWRQAQEQESARQPAQEPVKWPYQVPPAAGDAFADQAQEQANDQVRHAIKFNQTITVNVKSKPVRWQGNDYHLAEFHEIIFHRDGEHLKAWLKGSITTFDDVNYRVSIAVFADPPPSSTEVRLLGAATAACPVQRVWAGYVTTMPRTVEFDFDQSQAFERATSFSISIAERNVLTPDDWQKDDGG